jgi:hypothetical protein
MPSLMGTPDGCRHIDPVPWVIGMTHGDGGT